MNVPTWGNKLAASQGPDFVLLDQVCVEDPHPNHYCIQGQWGFEYPYSYFVLIWFQRYLWFFDCFSYVTDYVSGMLSNFEKEANSKPIFMWSNFIDAHEPDRKSPFILIVEHH